MDIRSCTAMAKAMPPNQSLLMIGAHGIGKSQIARQLAAHFHAIHVEQGLIPEDLPICDDARGPEDPYVDAYLIDQRLSQKSEGDIIGLPELVDGVTRFCPPAWFMAACRAPRLVFLDEINRSTPEVMQAGFQLVLDYELNGFRLHPQSRVYAAVNPDQGGYMVNAMDGALFDRFAVVELTPTVEDWLEWAEGKGPGFGDIMFQIVQFIKNESTWLDPPQQQNPGEVYPSRRSWELLCHALRHADLGDCYDRNPLFFSMALSRLGVACATAFQEFVVAMDRQVSAEDVLNNWSDEVRKRLEMLGPEKYNIIVDKIGAHGKENTWTTSQIDNIVELFQLMPGEHVIQLWNLIANSGNVDNARHVHEKTARILLEHLAKEHASKDV